MIKLISDNNGVSNALAYTPDAETIIKNKEKMFEIYPHTLMLSQKKYIFIRSRKNGYIKIDLGYVLESILFDNKNIPKLAKEYGIGRMSMRYLIYKYITLNLKSTYMNNMEEE
jgi:hypothetical protein